MRIAIVGFGLIGGSIARAIRGGPGRAAYALSAWSPSGEGPRRAVDEGIVDDAPEHLEMAIHGAELVVLAGPPIACLDLVERLSGPLRPILGPDATVTDVAGTKRAIVARADTAGLRFVGGHPMAGRETTGYGASVPDLFVGRPWVVVPGARATAEDVARVEGLATACGARIVRLTADVHDAATAAISHVPLVIAAALVEAIAGVGDEELGVSWAIARGLAASGWRDMTRLARGDIEMGAGIAATNATYISAGLRRVRAEIDAWLADLDPKDGTDPDPTLLAARFGKAHERLDG